MSVYSICISKQIRYNLESEKYTICIVQDNVGELVMSSGPLWNLWLGGNCSGMILWLLAPFEVLTCGLPPHITCIIQSTGYLHERWHLFYLNNYGRIPEKTTATWLADRFLIWENDNRTQERHQQKGMVAADRPPLLSSESSHLYTHHRGHVWRSPTALMKGFSCKAWKIHTKISSPSDKAS